MIGDVSGTPMQCALTIAGSDSSGGAGIQADLKTFESLGVWGASAIVALTAQNTHGVHDAMLVPPAMVRSQIEAVTTDLQVAATKTGMLATAEIVGTVARAVRELDVGPLVVDPVLVSSHGNRLLDDEGLDVMRMELLPFATLVTPNLEEAAALLCLPSGAINDRSSMEEAARALHAYSPHAVVITGGHLQHGGAATAADVYYDSDVGIRWMELPRLETANTHGTGCVFSAAVTAHLARGGAVFDAVREAKRFVTAAISASQAIGGGVGPVNPGGTVDYRAEC